MRAIPRILKERPNAEILIIGDEAKAPYGLRAPKGETWKSVFYKEIKDKIDPSRIHFTGTLSHSDFLAALQISRAHVYLTYPFVLSWSLIEAMSCGCLVLASDTPPVRDVVNSGNGVLFPFFESERLAGHVVEALASPDRYSSLRKNARDDVATKFDMRRKCVPEFLAILGREPVRSWLAGPRAARLA
jgi:glycosyltransferase involved in cell wall biosynthesis